MIALNSPSFDGTTFDLHAQLPILDQKLGLINATNTNLRPFERSGGKLIEWQGWDDAAFTLDATERYYDDVFNDTASGMLPGVGHCGTGPGPDKFGEENFIARLEPSIAPLQSGSLSDDQSEFRDASGHKPSRRHFLPLISQPPW